MKLLETLIAKAKTSKKHLWLLNRLMRFVVPFNKPHGFSVVRITETDVQTLARYQKRNFNHVKGIHACALATVGELSAGLAVMSHFSPMKYRIIMSTMHVDYHYQAKKSVISTTHFSAAQKNSVLETLKKDGKTLVEMTSELKNTDSQLIAVVKTTWQIKPWDTVKTKV